ncbi:MAG: NUDIX domain-containing protein [Bacteroidales bacterium]|nr:NUDIX domain-containing protein [Bacteroidales bacterium]MDT8430482.1 NUDIX domain-containing protein [Bacteroidales bacterium]
MNSQKPNFNPHLSIDCVIFGFDGSRLRVLLVERMGINGDPAENKKHKLPGDLIHLREDLEGAAKRVLMELTGLENIFLRQFSVFGEPDRISDGEDKHWLEETSGVTIDRVVTTAYYSLIRIDKSNTVNELSNNATWHNVKKLPPLTFDHKAIILKGLKSLRNEIRFEPLCFELLPGKFTVRQIQTLYEVVIGHKLDNRNFRKKLLKACYIEPLKEKQKGVAHKPALYYRFNKKKYEESRTDILYYNF